MPVNVCSLSGTISTHPEYHQRDGVHPARLTFSLRFSARRRPEITGWIDCVAWSQTAERMAAASLSRGDVIAVSGELKWSSWRTKLGERRSRVGLVLDDAARISKAAGA